MKILIVFSLFAVARIAALRLQDEGGGILAALNVNNKGGESYEVHVEEHNTVAKNGKSHEVTTVSERKKEKGGNETSSSKTTEVIRYPNGTIRRIVKENGGMKPKCASNEQCGKGQYCNTLLHSCFACIDKVGCFNDNQCCGGASCVLGTCQNKTGDNGSPCTKSSECNSGLHCVKGFFRDICKPFKEVKLGEKCQKEFFGPDLVCADGLECKPEPGHVFFPEYKCVKKGSQQDVQAKQHGSFWDWENPFDFEDI